MSALVEEINQRDVDVVALSGDLTQRARHSQYRAAVEMIDSIVPPVVVVPGNHDVYPWWRPVKRIIRPLGRYKQYFGGDLKPVFESGGIFMLGINSAYGRTIKGGLLARNIHREVFRHFHRVSDRRFKVLVLHHHLSKIQALGPHDVARNARRTLKAASRARVDLVLCGHLHVSHVEPIPVQPARHQLVIASAGTATSSRGRMSNRDTNFYNIIDVFDDHFVIEERKYDVEVGGFVTEATREFPRS